MALSPAVGALLGTGLELAGGLFSNKKNIDLAREQMDFQREMSNTQYQRSAKDLEKAGLNRILALGAPASTPAGARPNISNPAAGMANSARNLSVLNQQKKLLEAQTAAANYQGWTTGQQGWESTARKAQIEALTAEQKMKLELWRRKPWLFELQQMSNPVSTGISSAGQLLKGGGNALRSILKGSWK